MQSSSNGQDTKKLALETTQLNCRIDAALMETFKREVSREGKTMNQVVEQLIESWLAPGSDRHKYHLDGTVCPMSAMLDGITEAVRANLERRIR